MQTAELRKKIQDSPKYPGTKNALPSNLVNNGFPSCFNLSFGEGPMHEAFGQYLNYDKDLVFSTIQPCIRHEDWRLIKEGNLENYRYLALFDMAGIGGMTILQEATDKQAEVAKFHIKAELDFLKSVGLEERKLKILYFKETSISEATSGKYQIDKNFPTDPFFKYWIEIGLKQEQLMENHRRDTLLALNVYGLPTPWGYRYEILYEHNGNLWDIGTVEYLTHRPLFDDQKKIIDVVPFNHCLGTSVVGLERLSAIINGKNNIWEIDTIYPLIDFVKESSAIREDDGPTVVVQAFRPIHKVISDGNLYKDLNTRRKEYMRSFYREFFSRIEKLGIRYSSVFIEALCKRNAKLNPWYPELLSSLDTVVAEFDLRKKNFENDQSAKTGV